MKVIMYMSITANGMIATEHDDSSFVTETVWRCYSGMIKKNGNMIIGRRTYEVMIKNNEFNNSKLNKIKTVVLTSNESLKIHNPKFIFTAKTPQEALDILRSQGFKTIMVCGGGGLNSSFMEGRLVDEIYLAIEPFLLGKGIKLFAEADFQTKLKLIDVKRLSKNEIQLHYKARK